MVGRVGPAPLLGEDPRHLAALGVGVLDDDDAAGAQQPVRGALDAADQVEAVLAGEQGEFGVVVTGLGGDVLPLGERDVRRVGDDEVDLAVEVGEAPSGASPWRRSTLDPSMFLRAHTQGVLGQLHGVHPGARAPPAARASAMAPEPVHRSTISGSTTSMARTASMAQPTTDSVSGRGTNTPGPTWSSR